jgi:hypothetical protein
VRSLAPVFKSTYRDAARRTPRASSAGNLIAR